MSKYSSSILHTLCSTEIAPRERVSAAGVIWMDPNATPAQTRAIVTERRHIYELRDKALAVVQQLEKKLEIVKRWEPQDEEWEKASIMVGIRRYQQRLDSLEGLVVARMFELTKMNMSQTGVPSPF